MAAVEYSPYRRGAVELRAHSYAPRLDAHRRRRPGKLAIARRPRQPRPRLRSTAAVYRAGVLLAPPQAVNLAKTALASAAAGGTVAGSA
eukprot:scaffold55556_cov81-Phaeocystis_antarctica.AAC.1